MRETFHSQLDTLLDEVVGAADVVREMLADALRALIGHDTELETRVRQRDEQVDDAYERVQNGLLRVIALQAPVAGDLRLVSSLIHVNLHIERMGDYAASIAKMGQLSAELVDDPDLAQQLHEMGERAQHVAGEALRSFVQRDVELARTVGALDDKVDRLNIGIFHRLVRLAAEDETRLEWATHMILVARLIERWSDHAVDIAEQTVFVETGSTVELSSNEPGADRSVPASDQGPVAQ